MKQNRLIIYFMMPFIGIVVTILFFIFYTYLAACHYIHPIKDSLSYKGFMFCHVKDEAFNATGWHIVHKFTLRKPLGCFSNDLDVYIDFLGNVCGMGGKYQTVEKGNVGSEVIRLVKEQELLYDSLDNVSVEK